MLTIHKFDISYPIEVPKTAALLKVAYQEGILTAWYCVDTDDRDFEVVTYLRIGTGWNLEDYGDIDYVDVLFDGPYVWHIYKKVI